MTFLIVCNLLIVILHFLFLRWLLDALIDVWRDKIGDCLAGTGWASRPEYRDRK